MLLWDLLWSTLGWTEIPIDNQSIGSFNTSYYISSITANINVPNGLPGLAIASPSTYNPNYYFHWVRDGAITIDSLVDEYNKTQAPELASIINNYISSSTTLQQKQTRSGLGEPKFYVDGTPFDGPWGRPQNDGPALRAMVSAKWAYQQGTLPQIWAYLRTDLEYTAHEWALPGYDLWEELYGYHFFTSISQYGAMKVGAFVASLLGENQDAERYSRASDQIVKFIESNFMPGAFAKHQYVVEHFPPTLGGRQGLDAATVIAILELESLAGWTGSPLAFSLNTAAVKASVNALIDDFKNRFPINHGSIGGIGRYPEDEYDGVDRTGGNPWFICTASVAEALVVYKDNRAQALFEFIEAHRGQTLSEQMDSKTGYMRGAENLTWSYSSCLRAWERQRGQTH